MKKSQNSRKEILSPIYQHNRNRNSKGTISFDIFKKILKQSKRRKENLDLTNTSNVLFLKRFYFHSSNFSALNLQSKSQSTTFHTLVFIVHSVYYTPNKKPQIVYETHFKNHKTLFKSNTLHLTIKQEQVGNKQKIIRSSFTTLICVFLISPSVI